MGAWLSAGDSALALDLSLKKKKNSGNVNPTPQKKLNPDPSVPLLFLLQVACTEMRLRHVGCGLTEALV